MNYSRAVALAASVALGLMTASCGSSDATAPVGAAGSGGSAGSAGAAGASGGGGAGGLDASPDVPQDVSPEAASPTCTDAVHNGSETDIDCGGGSCPKCADSKACASGADCESGSCVSAKCQAPSCTDNVKNGAETDQDCGGSKCPACADGKACLVASDCTSATCVGNVCQALTCANNTKDGTETDIDCGGSACPKCGDMSACLLASDCESGVCAIGTCLIPTCTDGVKNGGETDQDCGGPKCAQCGDLKGCASASDCVSGVCSSGLCQPPGCSDSVKNGKESDVDCGGGTCPKCADQAVCKAASDCQSEVCTAGVCQVATCTDQAKNASETDVDCGGIVCPKCADDLGCNSASDCVSLVCAANKCQAPTCTDTVQNAAESDVDCGGGTCPKCADNLACGVPSDCQSAICTANQCQAASCTDSVKNALETDVDCGGGACPKCVDGKLCSGPADCTSSVCFQGKCGRRSWTVESNGSNVGIPANNTWITAAGLTLSPVLATPGLVLLRWTGTIRWAGGGNGICHVGERFVIDGVPTGHPTWGNAITVQEGATRPHTFFSAEIAVVMQPGTHSVYVQMTDANGYGSCYLDGDGGLAYDRSRLAATVYDPTEAWYAESNNQTGALGSNSPWTDIPGASLAFNLAQARHVQFSVQGTELVQGADSAHCAYRLVVDGTALGDPNHGQTIAVTDGPGGWWAPVGIKYGADYDAGNHTVKVQVRNSSSSVSTCNAAGNNEAYSRFHLSATATPQGGVSRSIESTGPAQVLAPGSAWTQVGGLSTSLQLASNSHVQFEIVGSQRTTVGTGQCGYRFVVDGVGLGDPNHGQAINIGTLAKTWWMSAGALWGMDLPAGSHTLGVEVRDTGSGNCGVNGDALGYGRMRLLVRGP
ncbi:MAG: hypothetical protein HY898_23495 [Deltaproteobacteria bacterium]|nr:hypothetical protein [Deltaproteobacteria bacterium]